LFEALTLVFSVNHTVNEAVLLKHLWK